MNERTDHEGRAFALLRSANPVKLEDIRRELDEERLAAARAHVYATLELPQPVPSALQRPTRPGAPVAWGSSAQRPPRPRP
jgi:hypothetical protein